MSQDLIKSYTNQVVDETVEYARNLVQQTPVCVSVSFSEKRPAVDLTLIIDGSRNAYENLQLINVVSELADVSSFGSFISVIHGTTGQFLVNRTRSIANVFEQLRNVYEVPSKLKFVWFGIAVIASTPFRSHSIVTFKLVRKLDVPACQPNNRRKSDWRLRRIAEGLSGYFAVSSYQRVGLCVSTKDTFGVNEAVS